jgi:ABC-type glycerol-3-phosphate transport system permease component
MLNFSKSVCHVCFSWNNFFFSVTYKKKKQKQLEAQVSLYRSPDINKSS